MFKRGPWLIWYWHIHIWRWSIKNPAMPNMCSWWSKFNLVLKSITAILHLNPWKKDIFILNRNTLIIKILILGFYFICFFINRSNHIIGEVKIIWGSRNMFKRGLQFIQYPHIQIWRWSVKNLAMLNMFSWYSKLNSVLMRNSTIGILIHDKKIYFIWMETLWLLKYSFWVSILPVSL